MVLMVPPIL